MNKEVQEIIDMVKELQKIGEVIAGSPQEKKIVEYITSTLRNTGIDVKRNPITVMNWMSIEAKIRIGEEEYIPTIQPYTPTSQVEGRIVHVGHGLSRDELEKIEPYETIALVKLHENLDYYETQYTNIMDQGALAIIFYDPYPSRRRILVASGSIDYPYRPGKPLPIPVLHVTLEEGKHLLKKAEDKQRIEIETKTRVKHDAEGYNIIASIPGKHEDKQIILSAHHDHWFTGASDNLIGVAMILKLAEKLSSKHYQNTITIASFTAEESGAPAYTPWYWAYGSRKYVEELEQLNRLDEVVAVINIDAVARNPISINATGIELQSLLEVIARGLNIDYKVGYDHPYCDSYSFSATGIPATCINTLDNISDIYHTDLDTVEKLDPKTIEQTLKLVHTAVDHIASKTNPYETLGYLTYAYKLYEYLEKTTPPTTHIHAYRILEETRVAIREKRYKNLYEAFKELNKKLIKPVFRGTYEKDVGGFEIVLLPQLEVREDIKKINKAIELLDQDNIDEAIKVLEQIPRARIIPGIEYKINHTNVRELAERLKQNPRQKHNVKIILLEEKHTLIKLLEHYYNEITSVLALVADTLIKKRIRQ